MSATIARQWLQETLDTVRYAERNESVAIADMVSAHNTHTGLIAIVTRRGWISRAEGAAWQLCADDPGQLSPIEETEADPDLAKSSDRYDAADALIAFMRGA